MNRDLCSRLETGPGNCLKLFLAHQYLLFLEIMNDEDKIENKIIKRINN